MKLTCLLIVMLLAGILSFAQKNVQTEELTDVTVFLNAAELRTSSTFYVPSGKSTIVVLGVSSYLFPESLVINTGGKAEIASISIEDYTLKEENEMPELKPMLDSLKMFRQSITDLQNQIDAFSTEKNMLLANQKIGGSQSGVSIVELKQAADFYRERILFVNTELSKIQKKVSEINKELGKLEVRVIEKRSSMNFYRKKIVIDVLCQQTGNIDISMRYLVYSCGWAASYDLTATEIEAPIELKYKAQVLNNSGVNWNDVNVVLSTSDPMQGATAPTLSPWYLNYDYGYVNTRNDYRYSQHSNEVALDQTVVMNNQAWSQEYDNINVSELSTEFVIEGKHTIPSKLQPFRLDVTEYTLNTEYKYVCIPKMEHRVYLLARVTGWEKYELIDGDMNVYYNDTYIGVSRLNTYTVNDTLDLSLGRDNKILVTRTKVEDYSKKSLIGSNRKESHMYKIAIKNNRSIPIEIEIVDQVPVSQESEIEVEVGETSGADYNELTGIVKWNANIAPGDKKSYNLAYTVKYPKSKPVQMKKTRALSAPRF